MPIKITRQPGDLQLQPHVLRSFSDRRRIVCEYGTLSIPENPDDPASFLVDLAFVRLKSTSDDPGPPIFYVEGGPGESGIDKIRQDAYVDYFLNLRQFGDVILFDQRGTGATHPRLDCLERRDLPLDQAMTRENALPILRDKSWQCFQFWLMHQDIYSYMVEFSADDIDALREALGYEQIILHGGSYGSHLSLATIRRYPDRIARAFLGLIEGMDDTIKLPSNIQAQMVKISEKIAADPAWNTRIPDFLALVGDVLAKLEREPLRVPVRDRVSGAVLDVTLGKFDLQFFTATGLGSDQFISRLPQRYAAMADGDFSWLAGRALGYRRGWLGNAMTYMMDCSSGVSPERYARIKAEAPDTLLGESIDFPFPDISSDWGTPDAGPDYRLAFESDVPVLFISGDLDGRTPPSNALAVLEGFRQGHHILVENGTHSLAYFTEAPVFAAITAFLRGETVTITQASTAFSFVPPDKS